MNKEIIKTIIFDQHEVIKNADIVERDIQLDNMSNYVLVGLRRAGKSYLLYKRVRDLIKSGVDWKQIIYINFDDERLSSFKVEDFNSILVAANEITDKTKYYYFDEIQNVNGWERFARRLADQKVKVDITGSNAYMLSSEISAKLGGRYITKEVTPFSFIEFLRSKKFDSTNLSTQNKALLNNLLNEYIHFGGLPEGINLTNKREYITSVYEKVFLNDIVVHNLIRKPEQTNCLIHKIAETIKSDVSYTRLHNCIKTVGHNLSKDNVIDYTKYCIESFLIFKIENFYDTFVNKQSTPKYYFVDNGILNLFLFNQDTSLFENVIACYLYRKMPKDVFYAKSSVQKFEMDFVLPKNKIAIQACFKLDEFSTEREINSIIKFAKYSKRMKYNYFIVTYDQEQVIEKNGIRIKIVPLSKFLMGDII